MYVAQNTNKEPSYWLKAPLHYYCLRAHTHFIHCKAVCWGMHQCMGGKTTPCFPPPGLMKRMSVVVELHCQGLGKKDPMIPQHHLTMHFSECFSVLIWYKTHKNSRAEYKTKQKKILTHYPWTLRTNYYYKSSPPHKHQGFILPCKYRLYFAEWKNAGSKVLPW